MAVREKKEFDLLDILKRTNENVNLFAPENAKTRVERLREQQQKELVIRRKNMFKAVSIIFVLLITISVYKIGSAVSSHKNDPKEKNIISGNIPIENKDYISLSFGGDVLLDGRCENLITQKGEKYIFSGVQSILDNSDISMVNLENPVSEGGIKQDDKEFNFRAKPESIRVLSASGIDIVSLANNHILDYGIDALKDTLNYLDENKIKYAGAGLNKDKAESPVYFNINGTKIAIIASSRVLPFASWAAGDSNPGVSKGYDISVLKPQIVLAKNNADIVIIYMHWGEESESKPQDYQKELAHNLIDAGADAVIGTHPHVIEGLELYKGKIISYSLGNFVFDSTNRDAYMLNLELKNKSISKIKVIPCQIIDCIPFEVKAKDKKGGLIKYIEDISFGVKIDENGFVIGTVQE